MSDDALPYEQIKYLDDEWDEAILCKLDEELKIIYDDELYETEYFVVTDDIEDEYNRKVVVFGVNEDGSIPDDVAWTDIDSFLEGITQAFNNEENYGEV